MQDDAVRKKWRGGNDNRDGPDAGPQFTGKCPVVGGRAGDFADADRFRDTDGAGRSAPGRSLAGCRSAARFHGQPDWQRPDDRRLGRQDRPDAGVHLAWGGHQCGQWQWRDGPGARGVAWSAGSGQMADRARRADQHAGSPVVGAALCRVCRARRGGRLPDERGREHQCPQHQRLVGADDGDLRRPRGHGEEADREGRRSAAEE